MKKRQETGGAVPSGLTPLVIVPSLLGSRLQAQLNHVQTSYAPYVITCMCEVVGLD